MKQIKGFRTDLLLREDSDAWGRLAFSYQIAHCSDIKSTYYRQRNRNASYDHYPVTSSFVDSANEYLKNNPQKRETNLLYYINRVVIDVALSNVYSGHPIHARYVLAKRPSNKLFGKILYCYLLSLVPIRRIPPVRKFWHNLTSRRFV